MDPRLFEPPVILLLVGRAGIVKAGDTLPEATRYLLQGAAYRGCPAGTPPTLTVCGRRADWSAECASHGIARKRRASSRIRLREALKMAGALARLESPEQTHANGRRAARDTPRTAFQAGEGA